MNLLDVKNVLDKGVVGACWDELSLRERIVWHLIWATHWTGWHQTMELPYTTEEVWCVDCLRVKRK